MSLRTTDLYESSYFLCHGARLKDVEVKSRRRPTVVFSFEEPLDGERLTDLQESYHGASDTLVNMSQYRKNIEFLKDVIFNNLKKAKARRDRQRLFDRIEEGRGKNA